MADKIAPDLQEQIEWCCEPDDPAAVQLRQVLAVVRAAKVEFRNWQKVYGADNVNAKHPMVRALARLSPVRGRR